MATLLEDLFNSLGSEADLVRLVSEGVQEDIHLEFKTKRDSSKPDLGESERWQFSRALSGFANSDGGILVFGVETGEQERAVALKPITGVHDFHARLKKSLISTTQPVVPGVRIEVVPGSLDTDGFVKIMVPASDCGPHRAMLADREYFKRSTEGFYRLEHFDISDMFGRRPKALLELQYRLHSEGFGSSGVWKRFRAGIVIGLRNPSRSVAHFAYLTLRVEPPYNVADGGLDGNGRDGLPRIASVDGNLRRYGAGSDLVIHPGVTHDVTKIRVEIQVDSGRQIARVPDLVFICEHACDGLPLVEQRVVITGAELIEQIVPPGD